MLSRNLLDDLPRWPEAAGAVRKIPRDAVLMIEDGVTGVREGSSAATAVKAALASGNVYALTPDLGEPSIKHERLVDGVQTVDHGGFVDLVAARTVA
jgi:tRNA 2-thiouridine synthesizing protein B